MVAKVSWPLFILLLVANGQSSASESPAANVSVLRPSSPIVATLCEDVVLPCQLSHGVGPRGMEVQWTRPPSQRPVHLQRNGSDDNKDQLPEYRGRTEVIRDNLTGEAVALMIRNVTASDSGLYHCQLQSHNFSSGADLVLDVKAKSPCELQREVEKLKEANRELSAKVETLEKEQERNRKEIGWRKGRIFEEEVTLDPETAYPQLIISEDGKSVRFGEVKQNLTENPKRFTSHPCVLGSKGFTWGKYAWEVDTGDSGEWSVGAVPASVDRKGDFMMTPERKFWAVYMVENPYPSMSPRPRRIGLFLDNIAKQFYIYNAETMDLIGAFFVADEEIFPLFCVFSTAELKL
ncbi:butyrophilin subfamily 1 member A1-like [Ambystoma mexicanum]|uniref:butyrophilin subfamily 1 member A1-like n=1 Tax=Ambystoma mexicanum TaxID=8296 RepID=UPI0037E88C5F